MSAVEIVAFLKNSFGVFQRRLHESVWAWDPVSLPAQRTHSTSQEGRKLARAGIPLL